MSISFKKHQLVFLLMLAVFVFALFYPNFSFAQSGEAGNLDHSPITRGLCNVFGLASGNIGKAIAIFAIVAVGFGFFTGKFSIALVIGITLGIGILFGAPKIIAALTGEQVVDCDTITAGDNVACPNDIAISSVSFGLSKVNYNSITKSFTIKSESDDLAKISCYRYASDQIRVHFTPLVSSTAARTANTNIFTAGVGLGNLPSAGSPVNIPLSGNFPLTISAVTPDAATTTLTFKGDSFCPSVDLSITGPSSNCGTSPNINIAAAIDGAGTNTYLCVNGGGKITSSSIASGNLTHLSGALTATEGGGKLIIKTGFLGDVRRYALNSGRHILATCASAGQWAISTEGSAVAAVADCGSTKCAALGSRFNVTLNDK